MSELERLIIKYYLEGYSINSFVNYVLVIKKEMFLLIINLVIVRLIVIKVILGLIVIAMLQRQFLIITIEKIKKLFSEHIPAQRCFGMRGLPHSWI